MTSVRRLSHHFLTLSRSKRGVPVVLSYDNAEEDDKPELKASSSTSPGSKGKSGPRHSASNVVEVTMDIPSSGEMLDLLREAAHKFHLVQPAQFYCFRRGTEYFGEESSVPRLYSVVRPGEPLQLTVMPNIRAQRLTALLSSSSDPKSAAYLLQRSLTQDMAVAEAFVNAEGLVLLERYLKSASGNVAVYVLLALRSALSTRAGMAQCSEWAPSLLPSVTGLVVKDSPNPSVRTNALACLLSLVAALSPVQARTLLKGVWAEFEPNATLVLLAQDQNVPTATAAMQILVFLALQCPDLLPEPSTLQALTMLVHARDLGLRGVARQLFELLSADNHLGTTLQAEHAHAAPPRLQAVFGVLRGRCLEQACPCAAFEANVEGPCDVCGHFPARHKHKGKSDEAEQLKRSLEQVEIISKFRRATVSSPDNAPDPGLKQLRSSNSMHRLKVRILKPDEVEIIEELGVGSSATVFRGKLRSRVVAVKVLNSESVSRLDLMQEMTSMAQASDENSRHFLVQLFGVITAGPMAIVMEFCENGSLYHFLRRPTLELPWSLVVQLLRDCATGLAALHEHHLMHRDVKSLNYLITGSQRAKLADMGLTKSSADDLRSSMTRPQGTLLFCAPEILSGGRTSQASDVYAFGLVMWEVVRRFFLGAYERPFEEFPECKFDFQLVIQVSAGVRPTLDERFPRALSELIAKCWHDTPSERPSMEHVLTSLSHLE